MCGGVYRNGETVCPRDGTQLFALTQRLPAPPEEDEFDDFDIAATKVGVKHPKHAASSTLDTIPPDDSLIGRTLDNRYRIVRRLGKGSMAVVYVAEQLSIKRKVAVKVLSPTMAMDLAELNQRFEAEAQIIARLTHPNTVRLFDYGRTPDGRPYFVTELLGGRPLDQVLKEGPLNSIEVLEIIRQIARSLEEAHGLGIIHRDLKPANIFVDRVGGHLAVKILDFGVAKVAEDTEARRMHATVNGTLLGTPAYMSPEQCRGERVGPRSDLYSLGVIAYHALAGEPPFTGHTASLLAQHVNATPRLLSRRVPGLDPRIEAMVMSLLAKKPEDRPSSAGALASQIDDLERSGTVFAVPVIAPAPPPKKKTSKARLSLVAVAAGIGLALLAASFIEPEPREVPPGYVDAPVSDEVHHAFFAAVGQSMYADAIDLLQRANEEKPHYDISYNIIAAYDAWGGHCPEVMTEVERFMKLCMGCPRAETAAPRLGRIYERCSVSVMIGSVPTGAELWIDGVRRGTTPSVMNLPAGKHVAVVKHRGKSRKRTFVATAGRPAQLVLELE